MTSLAAAGRSHAAPESLTVDHAPTARWSRPGFWLAIILAVHLALGIWYSFANPLFEAGDEKWHYPVVKILTDGAGLPVQPESPVVYNWRQQGSHPPLYYLIAAALTFWIDTGPPRAVVPENPHAILGSPHALGNKNLAVARPRPTGADAGVALAVHLIRIATVLIGSVTVWATFALARRILPAAPWLAVLAAAWVAFIPELLFVDASVSNDALVTALSAVALVILVEVMRRPAATRLWILFGAVAGLAALAKLNGAGLAGIGMLAILWCAHRTPERGWVPRAIAAVVLLPTAIAGWWFVRNLLLYGDPTGFAALLDIIGRRSLSPGETLAELSSVLYSFWGVLGGFNIALPEWLYAVYNVLALAALAGLIAQAIRRRSRIGPVDWPPLVLGLLWTAFTFLALIRFTQITLGSQGRYLYPALPVLGLLVAWGLAGWLRPAGRRIVAIGLAGALAVLAAAVPILAMRPAYALPARLAPDQAGSVPNPIGATFDGRIRLIGYRVGRPDGSLAAARGGQPLAVTLYWQATRPIDENLSVFVHLLDRKDRLIGQSNSYPGAGTYPTSRWQPGEIVQDIAYLELDPAAALPALARLDVGLYRYPSLDRLPVAGDRARENGSVFLADARVDPAAPPPALARPAGGTFGDQIEIVDADRDPAAALAPGQPLRIDLRWRALRAPPYDYTAFVHLIDASGRLVAQVDSEPRGGTYPTTVWQPGEVVADSYTLAIPPDLPPGRYTARIGLYLRQTGDRLPADGRPEGFDLFSIAVGPAVSGG